MLMWLVRTNRETNAEGPGERLDIDQIDIRVYGGRMCIGSPFSGRRIAEKHGRPRHCSRSIIGRAAEWEEPLIDEKGIRLDFNSWRREQFGACTSLERSGTCTGLPECSLLAAVRGIEHVVRPVGQSGTPVVQTAPGAPPWFVPGLMEALTVSGEPLSATVRDGEQSSVWDTRRPGRWSWA